MSSCPHHAHAAQPPRADRDAASPAPAQAGAVPYAVEPVDELARRTRIERLKELLGSASCCSTARWAR